ncbi:17440_t:CDS:2, partial [Acaulospora morrowiae]
MSQLTTISEIKQEEDVKVKQEDEEMGNTNPVEVKQEQSRSQFWQPQMQHQPSLPIQQGDRRPPKRKASYIKWENRDRDPQDRESVRGDRGRNQDRRGGRQQSRNRGVGRDWADREEGEWVDIDFGALSTGFNRGDNPPLRKQSRI